MATSGPLRVVAVIISIVVALVAAFYASLLPELPVPSQVSKAAAALSSLRIKAELPTTNVTMASRPPVYFFSHGGPDVMYNKEHAVYPVLQNIGKEITQKVNPKAVVVFSAHWQAKSDLIQVNNVVENDLIYDFYGFPDYMYEAKYPSKGDPALASRIMDLLSSADIQSEGVKRGLDHGVWAGFHVAFDPVENPLNVPLVQVSLFKSEDPDQHYRLGQAVASLRDEGVVIIGAGMSVHNLRDMWDVMTSDDPTRPLPYAVSFDNALKEAVEAPVERRQMMLAGVCGRSDAKQAHPYMDHLMPVHVAAGAAGLDVGEQIWTLQEGNFAWAQYRFGQISGIPIASEQRRNLQIEFSAPKDDTVSKLEELPLDIKEEALDKASDLQKAASDFSRETVGMDTDKPVQRPMPALPAEVWSLILSFLPDRRNLQAAVHSSRFLLSLWNTNRVQLITNTLGMAPGVLEEAACAVNFPLAPIPHSTEDDSEWPRSHFPFRKDHCISIRLALSFTGNRNRCLASSCNLRDVSRLEKIHPAVRELADVYIKQCAASNPKLAGTLRERPVTLGERARIERAFYRFEIFRRVFGSMEGQWDQGTFSPHSEWEDRDSHWLEDPVPGFIQEFKECFSTVELIQMHCIYGFLKRLVTPAINDVLWHDYKMNEYNLVGHWATDERVSTHVLLGIENVYDIWTAFNDRRVTRLCYLTELNMDDPMWRRIMPQHDTIIYHVLAAELYTRRDSTLEVTKSKIAIHDTDESPRDACLAVASAIRDMGKDSPEQLRRELDGLAQHRQWGFVMWDQRRLDMVGFFEQNYALPGLRSDYLSGDLTATSVMFGQHKSSLEQRFYVPSGIWWDGGFGPENPAYTLGPREYNTWYPLAEPES